MLSYGGPFSQSVISSMDQNQTAPAPGTLEAQLDPFVSGLMLAAAITVYRIVTVLVGGERPSSRPRKAPASATPAREGRCSE